MSWQPHESHGCGVVGPLGRERDCPCQHQSAGCLEFTEGPDQRRGIDLNVPGNAVPGRQVMPGGVEAVRRGVVEAVP